MTTRNCNNCHHGSGDIAPECEDCKLPCNPGQSSEPTMWIPNRRDPVRLKTERDAEEWTGLVVLVGTKVFGFADQEHYDQWTLANSTIQQIGG
jgi:hypothetical protein